MSVTMTPATASVERATPGGGPPRLLVDAVSKRWRRRDAPLLDGVDLELEAGMLAYVIGRNGAGKTTLLRILAGLIAPDRGTVAVDGLRPGGAKREYQRRIGFLAAGSTALYARLTVRQHLDYWSRLALLPAADRRPKIEAALDRFQLRDLASRRADRISMGERQRLRLALAFLHDPVLLLLDEPWTSLDGDGGAVLNRALLDFAAAGGSAVICVPLGVDLEDHPVDVTFALSGGRLERA